MILIWKIAIFFKKCSQTAKRYILYKIVTADFLYDFLYENATDLHQVNVSENKEVVDISFGKHDLQKKSLEIIIKADKLKAFQFEISNIEILASFYIDIL